MKNAKKVLYYALKTFEGLFFTFVAIVALANVVMLFQYKVLNQPVPTVFGFSQVSILSGSMEPTLDTGDLAICKEQDEYQVGDAVLFEDGNYLVLHRIVDVTEDGLFVTKGDANNVNDENLVSPENIHGALHYKFDGLGTTMSFLTSWMGAYWLVITALFIYLAYDFGMALLRDSIKQDERNDEPEDTDVSPEESDEAEDGEPEQPEEKRQGEDENEK